MRHHLRAPGAVLLAVWLLASPAPPLAFSRVDGVEALARTSVAAVRGRVLGINAEWDAPVGAIYTQVSIAVDQSWGLATLPAEVDLKLLGGTVGDVALAIGGQARFVVGEQVHVFLDVRPRDRSLSVTGLGRGKWTIANARSSSGAGRREPHGGEPAAADDVLNAAKLDRLAALTGSRVHAAGTRLRLPALAAGQAGAVPSASSAIVARWHEADWGAPVPVDSAFGGHPLFPGGGLTQLLQSLASWSAAGSLQLAAGVERSPRCFGNNEIPDGRISVSYDDPCGEIADTSPVLAIGGAYYSSTDVRDVGSHSYWKITKGMVVLDNALPKFAGMSTGCYEELLTHELGHAIGLGHASISPAVMAPSLSPTCVNRAESLPLQAPDLSALGAPYPPSATAPGLPATPGGVTAQVNDHSVTLRWIASAGAAPVAYQLQAGSVPGGTDHGSVVVNVPTFTAPQVGTGVYYVRVVAVNGNGASPPTADLVVIVGTGLPGVPTALVAGGGPGGTVRMQWAAPAGAAPTGYVLLAGYSPGDIAARIPLGAPALVADHVASGTYYVRVAAMNASGMGPVSPEIMVVVP